MRRLLILNVQYSMQQLPTTVQHLAITFYGKQGVCIHTCVIKRELSMSVLKCQDMF
jgi:hypothetical protein